MSKSTFVSYDMERHGNYKNTLLMWEANENIDFSFNDNSTDTSINSTNISYIKSRIKDKIQSSQLFMVIIGDYAASNRWVDWEGEVAKDLGKRIIAVKIESHYSLPESIKNYWNVEIVNGFEKDKIIRAIR